MQCVLALAAGCMLVTSGSASAQSGQPAQGAQGAAFEQSCAVCHDNPATRAPARASLHAMSPNFIVEALTNGIMKAQGSALSPEQRIALAEFLTGQKVGAEAPMAGRCGGTSPPLSLDGPSFNGWGANVENRFQREPGIGAAQLGQLELTWAFGFPGVVAMFGQPTIAGGRVFVGSQNGHVYSLDMRSGCYHWDFTASAGVRTAITVARISDRDVALFGDRRGHAYALDAATGATIWKVTAEDAIAAQITGSPVLFEGRFYVPISVGDDSAAIDPGNGACLSADKTNCPQPHGPDFDLGSSANLITLDDGKRLLTIGQKSGMVWALDPDDRGRIVWQTRVGNGGPLGGVQWGTATDGKAVYAAVSDVAIANLVLGQPIVLDPSKGGGLHALAAATGAVLWSAPPAQACAGRTSCSPAQSGAVTPTAEYVLSGSVDGHMRAYAIADGRVLWDYDLAKPFVTVNEVKANGGSLDSAGPTTAGGMLFVSSGYGLYGGQPGNVLAAFAPPP
jgi:outer membrane protein assembly factor BamB